MTYLTGNEVLQGVFSALYFRKEVKMQISDLHPVHVGILSALGGGGCIGYFAKLFITSLVERINYNEKRIETLENKIDFMIWSKTYEPRSAGLAEVGNESRKQV
jgi:hypothetical protein